MSNDPMSVYSQGVHKKKRAPPKPAPSIPEKSLSDQERASSERANSTELPENWREQLAEVSCSLHKMREQGQEVAERYQMSEHEFEAYMNNPENFSSEEWELICHSRENVQEFVHKMKTLLADYQPPATKKRSRGNSPPSWINVDG